MLKDKLEEYINNMSVAGSWSQNAIQTTYAWLKGGLKPRCITRDLKWGFLFHMRNLRIRLAWKLLWNLEIHCFSLWWRSSFM
jgi:hypothetical protein